MPPKKSTTAAAAPVAEVPAEKKTKATKRKKADEEPAAAPATPAAPAAASADATAPPAKKAAKGKKTAAAGAAGADASSSAPAASALAEDTTVAAAPKKPTKAKKAAAEETEEKKADVDAILPEDASAPAPVAKKAAAKGKKAAEGGAEGGAEASATGGASPAEVKKFMASLAKRVVREVKKTAHNQQKKPYTKFSEGIPSRAFGCSMFTPDFQATSSKVADKRILEGHNEIAKWLGLTEDHGLISGCKFDGKVWFFGSMPMGPLKATVAFESAEATIKSNIIDFKFRTYIP